MPVFPPVALRFFALCVQTGKISGHSVSCFKPYFLIRLNGQVGYSVITFQNVSRIRGMQAFTECAPAFAARHGSPCVRAGIRPAAHACAFPLLCLRLLAICSFFIYNGNKYIHFEEGRKTPREFYSLFCEKL